MKLDPDSLRDEPADYAASHPHELTPVEKFVATCKGMLVGDDYTYAEHTIRGILETVEKTGRVTPGQRQAIENIGGKPSSERPDYDADARPRRGRNLRRRW